MGRPLIYVHGIASPDEAARFESLGADWLGVIVGGRPAGRVLDERATSEIKRCLKRAKLFVEAEDGGVLSPDAAHRAGADVVQAPWGSEVSEAWREALGERRIGWALSRVPADEDDDPSWVESRLSEAGPPPPVWVQIDVCRDLEDGWSTLRDANESELDVRDLDSLARGTPLVFSWSFRPDNVHEIRAAMPHAHGFTFALDGAAAFAHPYNEAAIRLLIEHLNR